MLSNVLHSCLGAFVVVSLAVTASAEESFYPLGYAFAPMFPMQIFPEDGALIVMLDYEPSAEDWTDLHEIFCESVGLMEAQNLSAYVIDSRAGRFGAVLVQDACLEVSS